MKRSGLRRRLSAGTALVLTAVVGLSGLQAAFPSAAMAAGPQLTGSSSADAGVFPGDPVSVKTSATNVGTAPAFNLTATVVLPAGVTYVPGSAAPSTLVGDPVAYPDTNNPDPLTRVTTLVWANIADLQNGATGGLSFQVRPDATVYPVGSQFSLSYHVYANADPRFVPTFNPVTYTVDPATYDADAIPNDTITKIVPFQVSKSEPSPDHELMRGVHPTDTTPSTYTLKVTNNGLHADNNMVLVDYIPANIEYLGCGGPNQDNSLVNNPEYDYLGPNPPAGPGPDLNQLAPLSGCITPDLIETTNTEAPPGVTPGAVYTKVTWNLGNFAPGSSQSLPFYMGAAIHANTMAWDQTGGGTSTTPPVGALSQGVNLDNNNGGYTTQQAVSLTATNVAVLDGDYTGPVDPSVPVPHFQTTGSVTDKINDLSIYKTASPSAFQVGQLVTFSLLVRTGEYRRAHSIVVTDHLPSGLCPVDNVANYSQYTGSTSAADPACAPTPGTNPSQAFSNIVQNTDGTYSIRWDVPDMNVGTAYTITFKARALSLYAGTAGALSGFPTVSGDSFTNTSTVTGATSPAVTGALPGDINVDVSSTSQVTLTTATPTILKQVSEAPVSGTLDCTSNSVTWLHPTASPDTRPVYHLGDRICFRLTVRFPTTISSKDAVITDFLPTGVTYENGSLTTAFAGGQTTGLAPADINSATSPSGLVITLGSNAFGGSHVYAPPSAVYDAVFSAIVVSDTANGVNYDVPGNLMKFRYTNSGGAAFGLRDGVDFKIGATPRLDLAQAKTIASINGVAQPAGTAAAAARAGDVVGFEVALVNGGIQSAGDIDLWDLLPPGFTCATVSAISDSGHCTDGVTTTVGTGSVIVWLLPGPNVIPGQGSHSPLTYKVTVPTGVSVDTSYTNTTGLRSYSTLTNTGTTQFFYPKNNIDPGVLPAQWNDLPALDIATLNTPANKLVKANTTAVTEAGNATVGQATVGEGIVWTVTATIPHGTSVYNGTLLDTLPAGVSLNGTPTVTVNGSSNPSFPVTTPTASTIAVTFPSTYTVAPAAADTVVVLTVPVLVNDDAVDVSRGKTLTNRAAFSATADPAFGPSGTAPGTVAATNGVTVVEPNLTLTKTDNATNHIVVPGQGVAYTLTVRNANASNVSVAHNVVITDFVPSGMTVTPGSISPTPATFVVDGLTGITQITWNLGDIAPGASVPLTYSADVELTAASGEQYKNIAVTDSSSLATGGRTSGTGYNPTASDTVTVLSPTLTKSVTPTSATIGDVVTYTLTTTIPPSVNVPNATLLDTLPAGLINVTPVSATCVQAAGSCNEFNGSVLANNVLQPLVHGWYLGDFTGAGSISGGNPVSRVITITYTAQIDNVAGNVAAATLTNSASLYWNKVSTGSPVTSVPLAPNVNFDFEGLAATAKVTVTEPNVTITKAVDKPQLGPTDIGTYTLTVKNATGATVAPAYDVAVSDKVPTGLVVDVASISNGGVLDVPTNTITWTVPGPLAPGASATLTYKVSLAPSATLTSNQVLNNSAAIASYSGVSGGIANGGRLYVGNTTTVPVTAVFPRITVAKSKVSPAGTIVQINQPTQWRFVVTNTGGAIATGLSANDVLPANWTYTTGTGRVQGPTGPAVAVDPTVTPAGTGDTLTWATLPNLAPGQTATITYTAVPGPNVPTSPGVGPTHPHTNTVTITTATDASGATANLTGPYAGATSSSTVTVASADLRIVKSHASAFVPGTQTVWNIAVTNLGPDSSAATQTVIDVLPAGVTFVSATGTGWVCNNVVASGTSTVTCTRASALALNVTTTIALTVRIDPALTGTLTNTATVSGPTYDPVPGNNTSTDSGPLSVRNDIAITKSVVGTVVAGQPISWKLHVVNNGPSTSTGQLTVDDTLAGTVTNAVASGAGWTCVLTPATGAGQNVNCTWTGTLAPAAAVPSDITITGTLASSATGNVANTATVSGGLNDPNLANNTSSTTSPIGTSADLSVVKSHSGVIVPGTNFDWTVLVHNAGPSDAVNPHIVDTLPAGLTYVSAAGTGWTCVSQPANKVACDYGSPLAAGTDAPLLTLTTAVASNVTGTVSNNAVVSSTTTDPVPGNNTSTDTITGVVPKVDLAITKTHTGSATAGQNFSYTLNVNNNGPSDEPGPVVITDMLPAGMTYVSASGGTWNCVAAGQTVTCTYPSGLVKGASAPTLTLTVAVDPAVSSATLTNIATVGGTATDTNPLNNAATDVTNIVIVNDIAITKTALTPAIAGLPITWKLHVVNNGPSTSTGQLTVDDNLPASVTDAVVTATGWNCVLTPTSGAGQNVNCTWTGTLAPGAAVPTDISITATVLSGTTAAVVNTATVAGGVNDPNSANNTSTTTSPVGTSADLSIVKSHVGTLVPGTNFDWTLLVHNDGPSDAVNPHVVDTLPTGLTYVSASGSGWTCAPGAGNTVVCDLATPLVALTDAPLLTLTTAVASNVVGNVTNGARVSSITPDPNANNNISLDLVPSSPRVDLAITKTHTGTATAGQNITYTLNVVNNGPSDEPGPVLIVDTLPTGMSYVSGSGGTWNCAPSGQDVNCTYLGKLTPGASAPTLTLTVAVSPDVRAGTLDNIAVVSGVATETDPSNNTATDPTQIVVSTDLSILKIASSSEFDSGTNPAGSFSLTVTNHGPSTATDTITVADSLPAGLSYVSAIGTGWTCNALGQLVTCTSEDDVVVGANAAPITLTVSTDLGVGDPAPVSLDNSATVSTTPGLDTNPTNDTSIASVIVGAKADLGITKTHAVDPVTAGTEVPFTIKVNNAGPSPALAPIVVTDTLPAGMSYVSTVAPWVCNAVGQVVTCDLAQDLAAGANTPDLTLTTHVSSAQPVGPITNNASVSSSTPDPVSTNDNATDVVNVVESADLAIVKSHTGTAIVGQPLTYTLHVTNNGPSDASAVSVSDSLPSTLQPVSADGSGWTCTITGQDVACSLPTLAAGSTTDITVVATVLDLGAFGITNTATVAAMTPDPDTTNNSSTDTIDKGAVGTYDLKLTKTLAGYNPSTALATYNLVVTNVGTATHTTLITVVDTLPSSLTYVSGSGGHWTVSNSGQKVTATTPQVLAPQQASTVLQIVVKVGGTAGTVIVNNAGVTGGPGEVNLTNNTGSTQLVVGKLPHTGAGDSTGWLLGGLLVAAFGALLLGRRQRD